MVKKKCFILPDSAKTSGRRLIWLKKNLSEYGFYYRV